MRKLWHFGKMCQQQQITAFHQALLIFNFLTQMYTRMVARPPRIGVGPGFDSQGSVTFFHKYCFPNLHWIHWANPWWSDSAIYSSTQVHDFNVLIKKCLAKKEVFVASALSTVTQWVPYRGPGSPRGPFWGFGSTLGPLFMFWVPFFLYFRLKNAK